MKVKTGLKAGAAGLGDVVAEVTNITGVDRLAKSYEEITGKPCGCDERREKLNQLVPFTSDRP
jgi:hypothetical protein